jgi:hypothetical protein
MHGGTMRNSTQYAWVLDLVNLISDYLRYPPPIQIANLNITHLHPLASSCWNMSWQGINLLIYPNLLLSSSVAYVDTNLVGTGKIAKAAILGLAGGVWATTPGFTVCIQNKFVVLKS